MKKALALILALLMMLSVLAGCGSSSNTSTEGTTAAAPAGETTKAAASAEPVTISYWSYQEEGTTKRQEIIQKYNDTNTDNIKVELEQLAWSGQYSKLTTALASRTGPDVMDTRTDWFPQLFSLDAMEPLDEYMKSWEGYSDIYDTIWALVTRDGKKYGIPYEFVTQLLYYRKDLLEQANVAPPTTVDEFFDAAVKLTKGTSQYGYGLRGSRYGHEAWASLIFRNMENPEFTLDAFDNPDIIAANQKWIDTYKVNKAAPDSCITDGFDQLAANFLSGLTAMTIAHIKLSALVYDKLGDNMGVMPLPAGKYGKHFNVSSEWYVSLNTASKHKDESFKLMSYLGAAPQIKEWCSTLKSVPVTKSLESDSLVQDSPVLQASMKALSLSTNKLGTSEKLAEWTETLWPQIVQRALTEKGYESKEMMADLKKALAE